MADFQNQASLTESNKGHSTLDVPCTSANLFNLLASPNEFALLLQELCPRIKETGEAINFDRKNLHFWRFSPQTAAQLFASLGKALLDNGMPTDDISKIITNLQHNKKAKK